MAWGILMTVGFLAGMFVLWVGIAQEEEGFVVYRSETPPEPAADSLEYKKAA